MTFIHVTTLIIICSSIIGFISTNPTLLHWVLLAEITWIGFYLYFTTQSLFLDSLIAIIWSILLFCLATSESALGLGILLFNTVLFNNCNGCTNLYNNLWKNFKLNGFKNNNV